ncbi:MAG TPA: hypothetical protein VKB93_24540, partial [Thermoanaerobaculia bacterium]|nr:hypothetical protein [Thermoanaerobaculia bacterium]
KKSGDSVRVDVLRGRNRQTLVATLAEKEIELPRYFRNLDPEELEKFRITVPDPSQWRARVEALPNCVELQTRIRELETRLKDLEKKLQK